MYRTANFMDNSVLNKKYITTKNQFSFAVAGFGQNLIIGMVNSYILFFYTDVFCIGTMAASVLMIVARIWDALNDPIMGTIVDKTHTKHGKMRPYILAIALPLTIITALLFLNPNLSQTGKVVYAYVTYILWGMAYTVCDVPFWGLPSVMTPNANERVSFISKARLVHSIGNVLPMLAVPMVVGKLGNAKGYTVAGTVVAVIGGALFLLAYFGTEERTKSLSKAPSLSECFKSLKVNKPLRSVVLANVLGFARATPVVAGMYVATYLLGDQTLSVAGREIALSGATLNTVLVAGWGVAGYIGMLFTPMLCKRLNYRQIWYGCGVVGFISSVALFILGKSIGYSLVSIFVCLMFAGLAYGIACNINYSMIAESVDYVEWKTGRRVEGITVSFQTLTNKIGTALQSSSVSLALFLLDFIAPVEIAGEKVAQVQTASTLNGIFLLITLIPAIGWIISMIPMHFYTFLGKERDDAMLELTKRRAEAEAKAN